MKLTRTRRFIALGAFAVLAATAASACGGGAAPTGPRPMGNYTVRGSCRGVDYSVRINVGTEHIRTGVSSPVTRPDRLLYRTANGLGGAWSAYHEITTANSLIAFYHQDYYNWNLPQNTNWPGVNIYAGIVEVRTYNAAMNVWTTCSI